MIIDAHAHFIPPSLLESIQDTLPSFPSVRLVHDNEGGFGFSFSGGNATRSVNKKLSDVKGRIQWMDSNSIDLQIIGGWLDMFGYEMPVDEGVRWSNMINQHLGEFCARNARFLPLVSLPMQDGKAAALVLNNAHKNNFKGAMIGTQPKGKGGVLDDPGLTPFWEAAHKNRSVLFIHPVYDSGDDRVNDFGMNNAIGRITDTLISISRIIYSGHIEKYHRAKIIVGIGGATLPYVIGRMRRNYDLNRETLFDPSKALRMLYFDTLLHDSSVLDFLIKAVGLERVMLGSDMPFPIGDLTPREILEDLSLSSVARNAIESGVARDVFGI